MAKKNLFGGKETYKEELGEAEAVAKKKLTPAQFARGEKSEGHKGEEKGARQTAEKIRAGKMSPSEYAKKEAREPVGMKKGGAVNKKFIQEAIKKPGALRSSLGVKKGMPIPASKLSKAAKAPGKLGQRARLAQTLKGFKHG